jgi:hypothetical protein
LGGAWRFDGEKPDPAQLPYQRGSLAAEDPQDEQPLSPKESIFACGSVTGQALQQWPADFNCSWR